VQLVIYFDHISFSQNEILNDTYNRPRGYVVVAEEYILWLYSPVNTRSGAPQCEACRAKSLVSDQFVNKNRAIAKNCV
jgi:hypothetical protein